MVVRLYWSMKRVDYGSTRRVVVMVNVRVRIIRVKEMDFIVNLCFHLINNMQGEIIKLSLFI